MSTCVLQALLPYDLVQAIITSPALNSGLVVDGTDRQTVVTQFVQARLQIDLKPSPATLLPCPLLMCPLSLCPPRFPTSRRLWLDPPPLCRSPSTRTSTTSRTR